MSTNLLPPGFKDEIFDEASLEHKYKNLIINLFQSNGYELVKPPLIEYLNSKNNKNTFIIKEKYQFPRKTFCKRKNIFIYNKQQTLTFYSE